jgi:hypothetical protein
MAKAKVKKVRVAKTKEASASVVDPKYLDSYTKTDVKTASGKRFAVDKGDKVAKMLRGLGVDELKKIAREHGFQDWFAEKSETLNPGMLRMSLGNKIRGAIAPKKKAA